MNYFGYTTGVYGVKTGFTGNAGRCLVSACKRDNLDIIIVVLGANTKKHRTIDSINLINYTYENYQMHDLKSEIDNCFNQFLKKFSNNIIIEKSSLQPKFYIPQIKTYLYPIKKRDIEKISSSIFVLNKLSSPILKNSKIGVLQICVSNYPILNLDILLSEDIPKTNIFEYFIKILKRISVNI